MGDLFTVFDGKIGKMMVLVTTWEKLFANAFEIYTQDSRIRRHEKNRIQFFQNSVPHTSVI